MLPLPPFTAVTISQTHTDATKTTPKKQGKTQLASITGRAARNVVLKMAIGDLAMTGVASASTALAGGGSWRLKLDLAVKNALAVQIAGCTSGKPGEAAATWPKVTALDC